MFHVKLVVIIYFCPQRLIVYKVDDHAQFYRINVITALCVVECWVYCTIIVAVA